MQEHVPYGQIPYGQGSHDNPPPAWSRPYNTLAIVAIVLAFTFVPAGLVCGIIAAGQAGGATKEGSGWP